MINHSFVNSSLDPAIEQRVEQLYSHEIKVKRVKKELAGLGHLQFENVTIDAFRFCTIGVRIPVPLLLAQIKYERKNRVWQFELRIDTEYPFGHPQLHSLDKTNGAIAEAKDLLGLLLENQNWGPSIMLSKFVEELPVLVQRIEGAGGKPLGRYWEGEEYDGSELPEKGLALFKASEDTWRFMIKSTTEKMLAVSTNVILKLQRVDEAAPNRFRLELSIFMKDIIEIVTNEKTKQITVKFRRNEREETIYLTIPQGMNELLSMINPVQMVERRVKEREVKKEFDEQMIKDYGVLIEHYSIKDQAKSNEYLGKMRQAIKKSYQSELKE